MLKLKQSLKARVKSGSWSLVKLEQSLLFIFVFLLPTQLAYHFWPDFAYVYGLRVDYLSPTVYLTDLLFLLLTPFLFVRLKIKFRSIYLVFVLLVVVNIFVAKIPVSSFLKWLTVIKLILVGLYFSRTPHRDVIKSALIASVMFFTLIGLTQFILRRTIGGPFYYLGERTFTIATPGIAKIILFGKNFLRAYSTFPHPNSFAGFIIAAILIICGLRKEKENRLFLVFLPIVFLTESLGAALAIGLIYLLIAITPTAKRRNILSVLLVLLITTSLLISFIPGRLFPNWESFQVRLVLAKEALKLFFLKPIFGVGLNNFFSQSGLTQPVHNLFLLTVAETGIVGLVTLYGWLNTLLKKITNKYYLAALLFILFTGMVDHYWFTLPQNQLLLSLLIGTSINEKLN